MGLSHGDGVCVVVWFFSGFFMSDLRALRTRIRSVKSTQKTTRVMHMISANKYKKSLCRLNSSRHYLFMARESLGAALDSLLHWDCSESLSTSLGFSRNLHGGDPTALFIIVSCDRGLCGSFNSMIAKKFLHELDKQQNTGGNCKVSALFLGKKVHSILLSRRSLGSVTVLDVVSSALLTSKTEEFERVLALCDGKFSKIKVIYFSQSRPSDPIAFDLLPVANSVMESKNELTWLCHEGGSAAVASDAGSMPKITHVPPGCYTYYPYYESVLSGLFCHYKRAVLFNAVSESLTFENKSRMLSMEAANNNTKKVIKELTLSYNKARQDMITREIIETVSSTEALS